MPVTPPIYLISACLAGRPCRYDGTACPVPELKRLVVGGLTTPREPAEIRQGRVVTRQGRDVTAQFERGAEAALTIVLAQNIRRAILKERSPSCGCGPIYDGTFSGKLVAGQGITAAKLGRAGLSVCGESNYNADPNFFPPELLAGLVPQK